MANTDFSNVRVESRSYDSATLRWDYAGSGAVSVYRALSGGTFYLRQLFSATATYQTQGTTESPFIDDLVTASTLYDYKLSDDAGSTFSSTVTVQTQKQFPYSPGHPTAGPRSRQQVSLTDFNTEESITPGNLQKTIDELRNILNTETIAAPRACVVCPSNNAVVLDCSTGCYRFIIEDADLTDLNSISINCDRTEIDFKVPPNTTIEVCGWPETMGAQGDECYQAPTNNPVTNFPIGISETECPVTKIRIPQFPCVASYTKDCYSVGSLSWETTQTINSEAVKIKYQLTPASASCGGPLHNFTYADDYTSTLVVRSGLNEGRGKIRPTAGYSLYFGNDEGGLGTSPPYNVAMSCHIVPDAGTGDTVLSGYPMFGICVNVPESATIRDFTGLVLMLDYQNNNIIVGQYTNQDLLAGALPSTIDSDTLPTGIRSLVISNYHTIAFGEYYVVDKDSTIPYIFDDSGHAFSGTFNNGIGFFWVANTTLYPNITTHHAVRLRWTSGAETAEHNI